MDDADVFVGQHHGVLLGVGEGGVNLGMTVVVMTSQIERLLVQRGCNGAVHLVCHGQFDGFLDVLEGGIATLGLHLAELEGGEVDTLQVDDVDGAEFKFGLLHVLDGVDLQVEAQQTDGLSDDGSVAGDDGAALLVGFFSIEGAHGDFRSDAGGVAHGDG